MPKFDIKPSDDATEVAIAIDGAPITTANALQLDTLIRSLVLARAQLQPAAPKEPPLGEKVAYQGDPRYWTNVDPVTGQTLLLLRHDGLGWLAFMFPPAERDRLAGYLIDQAKAAAAAPGPAGQAQNFH